MRKVKEYAKFDPVKIPPINNTVAEPDSLKVFREQITYNKKDAARVLTHPAFKTFESYILIAEGYQTEALIKEMDDKKADRMRGFIAACREIRELIYMAKDISGVK